MDWRTRERFKMIGKVVLGIGIALLIAFINLNIFLAFKPL